MSPGSADRPRLWLDHASIQVPELVTAVEHLERALGLRATVTPAAPERHSRVHLDRSYLEVAAWIEATGWTATMFFLRFDDPSAIRAHLDRSRFAYRFGTYEGVDGVWDDVELDAGRVPLPILVRRTAPADVARDWPPALAEPHRCGATTLAEVHVGVPALAPALEAYARLLALDEAPVSTPDARTGRPSLSLPTASGRLVLLEDGAGRVEAVVLGVASMPETLASLGTHLERAGTHPVAWLDPEVTFGLALGFRPA